MTVKEFISSLHVFPGMESEIIVRPDDGRHEKYFNSNIHYLETMPDVAMMEIQSFAIVAHKRNKFTIVVTVPLNIDYEAKCEEKRNRFFEK